MQAVQWVDEPLQPLGAVEALGALGVLETLGDPGYPAGRQFGAFVDSLPQEVGFGNEASKHKYGREVTQRALREEFGRSPTLAERQGLQVVTYGESDYGTGWSNVSTKCPQGNCSGSNNWGAVIIRPCPPCPNGGARPSCPDGFIYRDSCPDGSACYRCFRSYPTAIAGARHAARVLYRNRPDVHAAAKRGDLRGMVEAMKESGYFTAPVDAYERMMRSKLDDITSALGEPAALAEGGTGGGFVRKVLPSAVAFAVGGVVALGALKIGGVI